MNQLIEKLRDKNWLVYKVAVMFVAYVLVCGLYNMLISSKTAVSSDKEYQQEFANKNFTAAIPLPDELDFAGEAVPLNYFDVREDLDRELLINVYWQSQTLMLIKRANRYFKMIEPILKKNGIPDDFKYLAVAESGLANPVSPMGAHGLWQFINSTGKAYDLEISDEVDERYHFEKSTQAACKYFKDAYKIYQNWTLVAASYNIGTTGLSKILEKQKVKSYYDIATVEETQRYVYRILALKYIFSDPEKLGFNIRKKDLYPLIPTQEIKIDTTIKDLNTLAEKNNITYKMLKYFNPWLRKSTLTVRPGKSYMIKIPKEGYRTYKIEDIATESDTTQTNKPDLTPTDKK